MFSRRSLILAVAAYLLLAQPLMAAEGLHGNLVSDKWLESQLKNAEVLILDASAGKAYATQHIAGAVSIDMMTYGIKDKPPAEMEKLLQSWGVSPATKIVLYDQGGSNMATRMFFSLLYYGVPASNLFILDGGLAKWQADGLPVTADTVAPRKGTFAITKVAGEIKAERAEVLTASGDTVNNVLLEALGAEWHYGQVSVFERAGHIPNSVLLPADDFYNPDKTFKSPEEIARMLKYVGVTPEQQIYTYCGGGVNASVPFFALKFILKYPKVKMYAGSELDWLADERGLPYWTYDAPFLMRQSSWLQWAGGSRIRMYVGSDVSIVDVRPQDAFTQGHVPFSVNVPAAAFTENFRTPEKLAAVLGPAGVNPSHEAVVASGAGLTKESALAFLVLEKLGQKRVSILLDSADKWAQLNYITKDPTVVGPKRAPFDVSIPPVQYSTTKRNDVIIADAEKTQGIYPKVFIASGKEMPAKTHEGRVVHVPYTDLLNPDGTPKAAKDIWNILTKAGVPRYAEVVCFSDDPGESAVNYFILRLMGYPDVKVLTI